MKMKLLGIITVLTLCLFLLPAPALAEEAEYYDLWVGGVRVSSANLGDIPVESGSAQLILPGEDDPDTDVDESQFYTLKLDDFNYSGAGYTDLDFGISAAIYSELPSLTIVLTGENSVTMEGAGGASESCGIYSAGTLTMKGSALSVEGGAAVNESYGIYVRGDISVKDGVVSAKGGDAPLSYGLYTGGNMTVSGRSTVSAVGDDVLSYSYGISAAGDMRIAAGKVTARGGATEAENGHSFGIRVGTGADQGDILVSGGTVTAVGSTADQSYGIKNDGEFVVTKGTVDAKAEQAAVESVGIHAGPLTISGGTVTAVGSEASGHSIGIYALEDIAIAGGTVSATAADANDAGDTVFGDSHGIQSAQGKVEISGGKVTAVSGKGEQYSHGICAATRVEISGGTVSGTSAETSVEIGGENSENTGSSHGINSKGTVTISGGTVKALGGPSASNSHGIYADTAMTISGGTISGTAGDAGHHSHGVCTKGAMTISAKGLTAVAGTAQENSCGLHAKAGLSIESGTISAAGGTAGATGYSYGAYVSDSEDFIISGGTVTLLGKTQAMSDQPDLSDYRSPKARASVHYNGKNAVTYQSARWEDYQYFHITKKTVSPTSGGEIPVAPVEREDDDPQPKESPDDVDEDDYYHDPVVWAVEEGVTTETATTFSPDALCTRAQMVTFLWRVAGSPQPIGMKHPFVDVSGDTYYAAAVQWAYEQGIAKGVTATAFHPHAPCTRAHAVTFLWRSVGSPRPEDRSHPFVDVSWDAYYAQAVEWAYVQGITGGITATTFGPHLGCTRAHMVTFLYRLYGR